MKKLIALLMALVIVLSFAACAGKTTDVTTTAAPDASQATTQPVATPENPVIRLATTTSVNDSGLLPYLLPAFEAETGYKVEVASAGTGVAIGYAKSGDADLLLVPDITCGNVLTKCMTDYAGATTAGTILGAKCPVIVTSRSAAASDKYYSIALAAYSAAHY